MSIECRVFIDDFQKVINRKDFNPSELTKEDLADIDFYFGDFYRFDINNRKLILNYSSSKVYSGSNVLSLTFIINDLTIKKGDTLLIKNQLFFTEFGPLQSNKMTIRISPFVTADYHETTFQDYSVSYQF